MGPVVPEPNQPCRQTVWLSEVPSKTELRISFQLPGIPLGLKLVLVTDLELGRAAARLADALGADDLGCGAESECPKAATAPQINTAMSSADGAAT